MTATMSLEEYHALTDKPRRGNKFNAVPCVVDGVKFQSGAEARRYDELKLLRAQGYIRGLRVHPKYTLQDAFTRANGDKVRAITYTADFEYIDAETGVTVAEDVKGGKATQTRHFRDKCKMFWYRFPEIDLRVVNA